MKDEAALEAALMNHLQFNHYPPHPISFVGTCKQAIKIANQAIKAQRPLLEKEYWESLVDLPSGYRDCETHDTKMRVKKIIEAFHLNDFLTNPEDEMDDFEKKRIRAQDVEERQHQKVVAMAALAWLEEWRDKNANLPLSEADLFPATRKCLEATEAYEKWIKENEG